MRRKARKDAFPWDVVVVSRFESVDRRATPVRFHTVNDHDAPMAKFFLVDRLGLHKRLFEEGAEFCGLVESDNAVY